MNREMLLFKLRRENVINLGTKMKVRQTCLSHFLEGSRDARVRLGGEGAPRPQPAQGSGLQWRLTLKQYHQVHNLSVCLRRIVLD